MPVTCTAAVLSLALATAPGGGARAATLDPLAMAPPPALAEVAGTAPDGVTGSAPAGAMGAAPPATSDPVLPSVALPAAAAPGETPELFGEIGAGLGQGRATPAGAPGGSLFGLPPSVFSQGVPGG
ncbi:hypothetical protein [Frigidibacter sp. MR17.24]|uniref:hypothetical protein n=1 Tax=Frigidibacter sp. MR17.24 TaxID=3127345 RepID=UPI003012EA0D